MFGRLLKMRSSIVVRHWMFFVYFAVDLCCRTTESEKCSTRIETIAAGLMTIKYSDGKNAYRNKWIDMETVASNPFQLVNGKIYWREKREKKHDAFFCSRVMFAHLRISQFLCVSFEIANSSKKRVYFYLSDQKSETARRFSAQWHVSPCVLINTNRKCFANALLSTRSLATHTHTFA